MRIFKTLPETMITVFGFLLLFLMISRPRLVTQSTVQTLGYLTSVVLPSIFPFMVMSSFLSFGKMAEILGAVFYPITRYLIKIDGKKAGIVVFLSFVGGFAAGACAAARLIEQKELTISQCKRLLPIIFLPSLPFCVLVAGGALFDSYVIGAMFALSNIVAGILTASMMAIGAKHVGKIKNVSTPLPSIEEHIISAIKSSTQNMVNVSGFILFFGILSGMLNLMLPLPISVYPSILLEFSTALPLVADKGIYAVCATLSVLGFSAFFQVSVILKKASSLSVFIASRCISVPLTLLILTILFTLFPQTQTVLLQSEKVYILPYQFSFELSVIAYLIIIISFKDFITKKGLQ